ncbi:hypothetical protein [uncultured Tateyamaria sp.]|uniref:hypothetical protein n=1 Tax=uncultured Tateyamaria sp. TaxID=455651 RepID=UPI0026376C95|nr:hypothetical protein [uncultured Tateyamaria sp.]
MIRVNQFAAAMAVFFAQPALAQDSGVTRLNEGSLIVCSTFSAIQTMYALAVRNEIQNLSGCWVIEAPMEIIVLQRGDRLSSITYRQFRGEDVIARMIANGRAESSIERVRENPWTPWYESPAWAFTAWLEPLD